MKKINIHTRSDMKFGFASFSSMISTSLTVFRGKSSGVEETMVLMLPSVVKVFVASSLVFFGLFYVLKEC